MTEPCLLYLHDPDESEPILVKTYRDATPSDAKVRNDVKKFLRAEFGDPMPEGRNALFTYRLVTHEDIIAY